LRPFAKSGSRAERTTDFRGCDGSGRIKSAKIRRIRENPWFLPLHLLTLQKPRFGILTTIERNDEKIEIAGGFAGKIYSVHIAGRVGGQPLAG
jgi:hypothetical protein